MRPSRITLLLALALSLEGCGTCVSSRGTLAGARPDATFVTEKSAMYVLTQRGIEHVSLDGRARRTVFARPTSTSSVGTQNQWHVEDISADFATWALGNDDTEIFVGDAATGAVRKVEGLGNRASAAAFSPDGKRLALGRHSDFSHRPSKDDDTLWIVDVATLDTVVLEPTTDHWPASIHWSADGRALWVTMNFEQPSQWITLPDPATGAPAKRESRSTTPASSIVSPSPLHHRIACGGKTVEADRWEPVVRVVDATDAGTVVAHLEGRERGFHDYVPDFHDPAWSPGCGYVIFWYDQRLWAVEGSGSGGPGPIIEGSLITWAP